MNREAAELHLITLAREHRIQIEWRRRPWTKFESHPGTRMVFVGSPTSPIRYLGALHEMGHIVSPMARQTQRGHNLTEEAAAWDWALDLLDQGDVTAVRPDDRTQLALAWASYFVVE